MTLVLIVMMVIGITGCGTYYMVKNPATGDIYYTDKIDEEKGGAVKFKNADTGSVVTIQNSEVTEIDKETYKINTLKKSQ